MQIQSTPPSLTLTSCAFVCDMRTNIWIPLGLWCLNRHLQWTWAFRLYGKCIDLKRRILNADLLLSRRHCQRPLLMLKWHVQISSVTFFKTHEFSELEHLMWHCHSASQDCRVYNHLGAQLATTPSSWMSYFTSWKANLIHEDESATLKLASRQIAWSCLVKQTFCKEEYQDQRQSWIWMQTNLMCKMNHISSNALNEEPIREQ